MTKNNKLNEALLRTPLVVQQKTFLKTPKVQASQNQTPQVADQTAQTSKPAEKKKS